MRFASFDCYSTPTVVLFLGLDSFLFIATLIISTYQIVYLLCKLELNEFDYRLKWLAIIAQLLCVFAQLGIGIVLLSLLEVCPYDGSLSREGTIGAAIGIVCYSFMLTTLYCLFALRTHAAFVGSIYKLSNKITKSLVFMFIILFTMNILSLMLFIVSAKIGLSFMGATHVKLYILYIHIIQILQRGNFNMLQAK